MLACTVLRLYPILNLFIPKHEPQICIYIHNFFLCKGKKNWQFDACFCCIEFDLMTIDKEKQTPRMCNCHLLQSE